MASFSHVIINTLFYLGLVDTQYMAIASATLIANMNSNFYFKPANLTDFCYGLQT